MRRIGAIMALGLLAGCGGADRAAGPVAGPAAASRSTRVAPPAPPPGPASDAAVRRALGLPARVPLRAGGRADPDDLEVVRAWFAELTRGEVRRAASRFALPARFQNLASVALIRNRRQAVSITDSLPCGAVLTETAGATGYVVYAARLVQRPGGDCGGGVGGVVRGAVRVSRGRIAEWYRLPDRSRPRPGPVETDDGPVV